MANLELFVEVLANVELDPDAWDQSSWITAPAVEVRAEKLPERCKSDGEFVLPNEEVESMVGISCETAACIAGWACLLSGASPRWTGSYWDGEASAVLEVDNRYVNFHGSPHETSSLACDLLDIGSSLDDCNRDLFHGNNDKHDVYSIGAEIFEVSVDDLYHKVDQRVGEIHQEHAKLVKSLKAAKQKELVSTG